MGRPPAVCSDVPSTSRAAIESTAVHDPPPRYSTISSFEAGSASTSKQALAEEIAATSSKPPIDEKRKPPDEKPRRTITIDSSFEEEDSDDSEESYRSSDEEPNEVDRRRPREKGGHPAFQNEQLSANDLRIHASLQSTIVNTTTIERVSAGASGITRRDSTTSSSVGGRCYGRGRTFCFGLLMIHSTFFTLFIIDLLILSYSLIFTISNYLSGPSQYHRFSMSGSYAQGMDVNELVINVTGIRYDMLLPLFAIQIFWLVSSTAAVVAIKLVQPLLQLPYMLISVFLIFVSLWVVMRSTVRLIDADPTVVDWILALAMTLAGTVFAVQFYFLYVKLIYIRALLRKRNAVVSSMTNNISAAEAHSSGGNGGARSSDGTAARPSSASIFAAAIEARIFRRQRRAAGNEPPNQKRQHDKSYSTMTVSTTLDEKLDAKRPPQDADCCSCASCCCDETYSTKSTVIVTDHDEEIGCQKY